MICSVAVFFISVFIALESYSEEKIGEDWRRLDPRGRDTRHRDNDYVGGGATSEHGGPPVISGDQYLCWIDSGGGSAKASCCVPNRENKQRQKRDEATTLDLMVLSPGARRARRQRQRMKESIEPKRSLNAVTNKISTECKNDR